MTESGPVRHPQRPEISMKSSAKKWKTSFCKPRFIFIGKPPLPVHGPQLIHSEITEIPDTENPILYTPYHKPDSRTIPRGSHKNREP